MGQKKGERPGRAIMSSTDGVDFCWHTKGWVKLPAQSIIIIFCYLSCAYKEKAGLWPAFLWRYWLIFGKPQQLW